LTGCQHPVCKFQRGCCYARDRSRAVKTTDPKRAKKKRGTVGPDQAKEGTETQRQKKGRGGEAVA